MNILKPGGCCGYTITTKPAVSTAYFITNAATP
jgi:hypothetical protein